MKKQSIFIILLLAVLAFVVGIIGYQNDAGTSSVEQQSFLHKVNGKLDFDSLSRVEISTASHQPAVTLEKVLEQWQVVEKNGYQADLKQLSNFLNSLNAAKVSEVKTALPKYHHKLGLAGLAAVESETIKVVLHNKDNVFALFVGKEASNANGQYVRVTGDNQTFLIDQRLKVATEASEWLDDNIFDIAFDSVREVSIEPESDKPFRLFRRVMDDDNESQAAEALESEVLALDNIEEALPKLEPELDTEKLAEHFELANLSEGEELQYPAVLNTFVRNIIELKLQDLAVEDMAGNQLVSKIEISIEETEGDVVKKVLRLYQNEENDRYFVTLGEVDWIYEITETDFKQLSKIRTDFVLDQGTDE